MVEPRQAVQNLRELAAIGAVGQYGYYEALDYTPARLRPRRKVRDRAFVHGAPSGHEPARARRNAARNADAANASSPNRCSPRRCSCCRNACRAKLAIYSHGSELADSRAQSDASQMPVRVFTAANTPTPEDPVAVQRPLSRDGDQRRRRFQPLERSRRHALARRQHARQLGHVLLRARRRQRQVLVEHAAADAAAHARRYEATFTEPRVQFHRRDDEIETHTDIAVSPEDDIELRRVRITNRSRVRRTIEVTSYAEVVLAPPMADDAQPGVQQSVRRKPKSLESRAAIVCTRRPRSNAETLAVACCIWSRCTARPSAETSYETDRMRFIGRGNSARRSGRDARDAALSGHARRGARSDRRDPRIASRWSRSRSATHRHRHRHRRRSRRESRAAREISRSAPRPIACSIWRGRTPGGAAPDQRRPKPKRSCTDGWPDACCTRTHRCAPMRALIARNRAVAVGSVGLRDFGRSADRAAADQRSRRTSNSSASSCRRTRIGDERT